MKAYLGLLFATPFLLLGGLLLIAWPIPAFIGAFWLADINSKAVQTPFLVLWGFRFILIGVICYPLVYIPCLMISISKLLTEKPKTVPDKFSASFFARIPIYYILLIVLVLLTVIVFQG